MTGVWLEPPWSGRRSNDDAPRAQDRRPWYDRDRARIIHSSAFRRLQSKTQVLGIGRSDFHRTRLTHSLETAQIANGLVGQLGGDPLAFDILPPPMLIEAVALAHDLGHPPFGHGGEAALHACMAHAGGFEGNAQTLRLLSRLEARSDTHGLDLARRTLLGVLKYPVAYSRLAPSYAGTPAPPKCVFDSERDVLEWVLSPFSSADRDAFAALSEGAPARAAHKSLDASILELADDIAYGVHDLEDAIALHLIAREQMEGVAALEACLPGVTDDLFRDENARKRAIGALVNAFVVNARLVRQNRFASPLLDTQACLPEPMSALLDSLKMLIHREVIGRADLQMLEFRGREIVRRLFETIAAQPSRFLPSPWRERAAAEPPDRIVCDYVASMTDEHATRVFELLFTPRASNTFGIV